MKATRKTLILVGTTIACVVLLAVFLGKTRFSASVVDLLASESTETDILRELATGSTGRLLILRLYSDEENTLQAAESAFIDSLEQSGSIEKTWRSGQEGLADAGNLLFSNRYVWLLPQWLEQNIEVSGPAIQLTADELARKVVSRLVDYLDSPDGMAMVDLIPKDPFLLMEQLEQVFPSISVEEDERETILWIQQSGSPFDEAAQESLFRDLELALKAAQQHQPVLMMEYSGVAVFADASKDGIKGEIERLNLLGVLLVLLIALYAVGNAVAMAKIAVVVVMAILVATTAVVVVFDNVHVIALVIGSILTGIAVDYGFHILLRENDCMTGSQTRKVVVAGSLSSALGFLVLVGAPLPFLQQVGIFVGFGLLAAMAAAIVTGSGSTSVLTLRAFKIRPGILPAWLGVALIALAMPGLFMLSWHSDISDLEYPLPRLKEKDSRLRASASPLNGMTPYLLFGENILGCRNELQQIDPDGNMIHAGRLLPTLERVVQVQSRMRQLSGFPEALSRELDQAEFYPGAFEDFFSAWNSYLKMPLSSDLYQDKLESFSRSLPGPLQNFVHIGERISWIMLLSEDAVDDAAHPNLIQLDQADMLSREFAGYGRTMWFFAGFCLLVLALSVWVYFGFIPGTEALAIPVLASITSFGIMGLWNGEFGLFHLVGGTLAFCISLDYGLFAATSRRIGKAMSKSSTISALTTAGGFALLATSHVPGVQQLALTVLLVIASTLLAISIRWPFKDPVTASLLNRIPHGQSALMVESIRSLKPDSIVATCNPHIFQPEPTETLVEAMAQCAALLLAGGESNQEPRTGMLVVVQACDVKVPSIHPDQLVVATVRLLSDAKEGLVQFSGECIDQDNMVLTSSRFSIFIPPVDADG